MVPDNVDKKTENLLVSVNDSGVSDHKTLLAGYKTLNDVLQTRGIKRPIVVLADGHGSRFDEKVMSFCQEKGLRQFILPPDTLGVTQKHDQINDRLHRKYEESKAKNFSCYVHLNITEKTLLSEIWNQCRWQFKKLVKKLVSQHLA